MRDHLEAAVKRGKTRYADDLRPLPISRSQRAIWDCYLSMQRWRGAGGVGASPLTSSDLLDFCAIYGITLTAWQADCIKAIDLAHLAIMQAED